MKRILIALSLLLPFSALAQDRYDVPQTGTKVGLTRTGINSNFTFLFLSGTNAFRTAVEKGSNINFVAKSPTNATQLDYCLTNGSGSAGSPQSPLTNDLDAAGNSIENLDAPEITNTTIFIRLWGTNVLALQGTTNVALNGVSLKDGPSDGNTPQGPWTNWIAGNTWGVSNAGTYGFTDTNTILFTLGTNRFEVQGGATTPTNLAWNGAALINVSGGGGGGAVTNNFHGWVTTYRDDAGTNYVWAGTKSAIKLIQQATNVIVDTGVADAGYPYVNITNSTFRMPAGVFRLSFVMSDGSGTGPNNLSGLWLYINDCGATNGYGGYPSISGADSPNNWNFIGTKDGTAQAWKGSLAFRNTSATNIFSIQGYNNTGGTIYNAFIWSAACEFIGP